MKNILKNDIDLINLLLIFVSVLFISECTKNVNYIPQVNEFSDILNMCGIPNQPDDLSVFCFSDLGAWHGYALPATGITCCSEIFVFSCPGRPG